MKDLINIRLEEIRKEHKLSRKGIEEISGFKARTIESYERGQNPPSKEYIEFISLYFGYKKEYIEGKEIDIFYTKEIDKGVKTILIYQSIFNYNDKKMAELLDISLKDYKNLLTNRISILPLYNIYDISKKLNIKFSCISNNNLIDEIENLFKQREIFKDVAHYKYFFTLENDKEKKEKIYLLNENGLDITPEYYASIIKQRNQPEIITPDTQKESIPNKYKEILELLPYASDSFTQNLKNKLLELKKAQQIEDL